VIHATSKAVLIAWDMGQGPTFRSDGTRAHALYRVYRDGVATGETHAEAFYDVNVRRGAVYYYQVRAVLEDGSESPVGPSFTVHVPRRRPDDRIAPTKPEKLTRRGWKPSSDSGSGVLAYFVERESGPQPWAVLWNSGEDGPTSGKLHEWRDISAVRKAYRLRALDAALNLSAPSNLMTSIDGWTVYTFKASSSFTLEAGADIIADLLLVGGGGAGGATNNSAAGGGGAGDMRDLHKVNLVAVQTDDGVKITADGGAETGGDVVVGAGGTVSHLIGGGGTGEDAEDSTFAGITAKGGGRGGELWLTDLVTPGQSVRGAPGGAGGGGLPWNNRIPGYDGLESTAIIEHVGGASTATAYRVATDIPYGDGTTESFSTYARENGYPSGDPVDFWEDDDGNKFWIVEHAGGYDGRHADNGGYSINIGGGGGGAHQPWWGEGEARVGWFTYDQFGEMEGGYPCNAMHGRPCDIRGWSMYEETAHALMFVDWYSGGGAGGAWLPGGWSWYGYAAKPGYGGGGGYSYQGPSGQQGADNSGGGGCGGFLHYAIAPPYVVDAGDGGSGIVVIRIRTDDEDLVTYPLITGTDPEATEFGLPVCLCDDLAVTIRRLPEYMTHSDCSGDEQCPRTYEETHA